MNIISEQQVLTFWPSLEHVAWLFWGDKVFIVLPLHLILLGLQLGARILVLVSRLLLAGLRSNVVQVESSQLQAQLNLVTGL